MYAPNDEMARAYLAGLRQEATEHRMAEQVSAARQAPPQPRAQASVVRRHMTGGKRGESDDDDRS
jgi:hypothetical protein